MACSIPRYVLSRFCLCMWCALQRLMGFAGYARSCAYRCHYLDSRRARCCRSTAWCHFGGWNCVRALSGPTARQDDFEHQSCHFDPARRLHRDVPDRLACLHNVRRRLFAYCLICWLRDIDSCLQPKSTKPHSWPLSALVWHSSLPILLASISPAPPSTQPAVLVQMLCSESSTAIIGSTGLVLLSAPSSPFSSTVLSRRSSTKRRIRARTTMTFKQRLLIEPRSKRIWKQVDTADLGCLTQSLNWSDKADRGRGGRS